MKQDLQVDWYLDCVGMKFVATFAVIPAYSFLYVLKSRPGLHTLVVDVQG